MESPLDASSGFTPTDDDRPAGEWLEGYWRQMAPWAIRLSIIVSVYCLWGLYWPLRNLINNIGELQHWLVHPFTMMLYLPALVMCYYAYQFGKMLQHAQTTQHQLKLEESFVQLRRFLIAGIVAALFWGLSSFAELYSTHQIINQQESFQEVPLESE
ncbi:MAG: hypothetical protein J0M29_14595 [Chitinophagales bacterium]|nr:hypothetical protein [Chitinophagales bacterium]